MLRKFRLLVICASMFMILMALSRSSSISASETQEVLAADFRTIDGSGNNPSHPAWGQANTQLIRFANPAYEDGLSEPRGGGIDVAATLPSPRAISNALSAQSSLVFNSLGASDYLWQWGQFIEHDMDLTSGAEPEEAFPISVPAGDPYFDPSNTGTQTIPLNRSIFDGSTGTSNARQQINEITAFVDASQVYGSDHERAAWKRSPTGNSIGGRLNTSAGNLLPFESGTEFGAGDVRANEQSGLTALHTLFMREHNRLANLIAAANPSYTDEQIYQRARALLGAEIQIITYGEFLDLLLGANALPPYTGYDDSVDPSISNEFSTAAYRVGHTMLPPTLLRLDANGNEIANGHLSLRNAFFNIQHILDDGIEPLLRGLAVQEAQQVDTLLIDDVRNFLFANVPGSPGFDLASLNIQRGRDHGLPTYNVVRQAIGLTPATSFADITSDAALQNKLATAYNNDINQLDLWIGGLAEDHVTGSLLGETFRTILVDQFTRLRDGDRFWYQNVSWTSAGLESDPIVYGDASADHTTLSQVRLSDIIRWNTDITNIQENVFIAEPVSPSTDVIYVSSHTSGSIGGLSAADEDVLLYDEQDHTQTAYPWSLHLNLDYIGITNDIDALHVMSDTSVLMSFESTVTVPSLGSVLPEDIVRFVPTNTGEETGGHFESYVDGSDIGLDASGENIDAIGMSPDGRLLISTSGSGSVPIQNTGLNLSFTAQDLIALTPTHLGASTSGRWEMYFDGSDVALSSSSENVVGVWVDPQTGYVYLSTSSTFAVDGLSGQALDIFVCRPILLGDITSCADFWLYFDGSEQGLTTGSSINAFSLQLVEGSETPRLYLSTTGNPTVGQISFAREDIIGLDTRINRWRVYFDGSDVGVTNNLNAFSVLADSILMSFDTTVTLPGVGQVTEHDIVRFVPTRTGDTTAGHFEWYFDGSDVDLSNGNNEDIDAIGLLPDGRLLISVAGTGSVTRVPSFGRADMLAFTPTSLGETTSGTWELLFDGEDVLLSSFDAENVAGVSIDPTLTGPTGLPVFYLTTWGNFSLSGGLTGEGRDLFTCTAHHLGNVTLCDFDMFFDGSSDGFPSSHAIDGITIGGELCIRCNQLPDRPEHIYVSFDSSGSIGGVTIADEDIVIYHQQTSGWESLFDGSQLAITVDANALLILDDQSILLSFESNVTIPGLGGVTPQDIVRFVPTQGQFEWYFNGSDVELTTSSENIDAIGQTPDGRLLISVTGDGAVTGVPAFASQDIIAFTPTQLGETTIGVWEMYFEGNDVWLRSSSENIDALWVDPTINPNTGLPENIYLSTTGNFSILGLSGDGADIFVCKPYGLGDQTLCLFELLYDGSEHGLTLIDGFSLDGQTTDYYFSTSSNSDITLGQIAFDKEDVLLYNTRTGDSSLYFDGSDVGLAGNDVNAAFVQEDGSILISLEGNITTLPNMGSVDPQDIIRFVPTSTGHTTGGTFEWYFDGQDVGLESNAENIDAIALAPNGDLLISIVGDAAVPGVPSYWDEDLLAFTPTQLGETTSGAWRFYFDGSDVNLHNSGNEDVSGAWVDATRGEIYLNTLSSFAVAGLSGDGADIFICTPGAFGDVTACAFSMFIDGSTEGFPNVDGLSFVTTTSASPNLIYVNTSATGANNGSSWANAYTDLQDALAAAEVGDEIWVAAGTYKPTLNRDRAISFQLKNGVALYGGFNGTESTRQERDWEANPTYLSGDLNGDDNLNVDPDEATRSENSYYVVRSSNHDSSTVLDGFTITGGNANNSEISFCSNSCGGGMYNYTTNPTINNIIFTANSARYGGAMYNDTSSPQVSHVMFMGNSVSESGGAIRNSNSSNPTITHVTFSGNFASGHGGGMANTNNSSPILTNSILWNNQDSSGRGSEAQIYDEGGNAANVSYSIVQGGWSGTGNLDADPLFISPINPDDAPTTDGDFHLQPTSPAIDAGDNSAVPADTLDLDEDGNTSEPIPFDLDRQPRFWDSSIADTGNGNAPIVDMGTYENRASVVIISEVAWAGTQFDENDQWIELFNSSDLDLNLSGWTLSISDSSVISLTGVIKANDYYLMERTDDNTISDIPADLIFTGTLNKAGDTLTLRDNTSQVVDSANSSGGTWPAGNSEDLVHHSRFELSSMERVNLLAAGTDDNWGTNDTIHQHGVDAEGEPINGTPKQANSITFDEDDDICAGATEIEFDEELSSPDYISMLRTSKDEDLFKFEVPDEYTTIVAHLTEPNDFDFTLYFECIGGIGRDYHLGQNETNDDVIRFNVGTQTGTFYLKVNTQAGFYSGDPYKVQVSLEPTLVSAVKTLIFYNHMRFDDEFGIDAASEVMDKLTDLAAHPQVDGTIIQLDQYPDVQALYDAWDATPLNPALDNVQAANRVADRIREVMITHLDLDRFPSTEYIVIVGDDHQIPFHRVDINPHYLDDAWREESEYNLNQGDSPIGAALLADQTLTDNAYGNFVNNSYRYRYLPELAVGRVLDTPQRILAVIDTFLEHEGEISLQTGAIAGYRGTADTAYSQCHLLQEAGLNIDCSMINEPYDGEALHQAFVLNQPDVVSNNWHTDHQTLITPVGSRLSAQTILEANVDLNGHLWWVIGCQSGLVMPHDSQYALSVAQALSTQGVTYIGNTGWAYASGDGIVLSELLYELLTRNITTEANITIGEALRLAKEQYFWRSMPSSNFRDYYYHEKVMTQATLFGLPMLRYRLPDMPESTVKESSSMSVSKMISVNPQELASPHWTPPTGDLRLDPSIPLGFHPTTIKIDKLTHKKIEGAHGDYYTSPEEQIAADAALPLLPQDHYFNFDTSFGKGHDVIWLSSNYKQHHNNPVINTVVDSNSEASNELEFTGLYPRIPVVLASLSSRDGTFSDRLVFTTGQFNGNHRSGQLRRFTDVEFLVGISNSDDLIPPELGVLSTNIEQNSLHLSIPISDTSGVHKAFVTYTQFDNQNSSGSWQSSELTSTSGEIYELELPISHPIMYFIQVMDQAGNVATLLPDNGYFTIPTTDLQRGWTHISLPLEPAAPISAENLCDEIASQGGTLVEIDRWHNAGWDGHICGLTSHDFELVLGESYFIKSDSYSSSIPEGSQIREPISLTLQIGWNSIGIPHTDAYTAESLCDEIISQGVTAVEIDRWHNAGWQGHICGLPFNDFDIERGVGYFVKASSAGTVTPSTPPD